MNGNKFFNDLDQPTPFLNKKSAIINAKLNQTNIEFHGEKLAFCVEWNSSQPKLNVPVMAAY